MDIVQEIIKFAHNKPLSCQIKANAAWKEEQDQSRNTPKAGYQDTEFSEVAQVSSLSKTACNTLRKEKLGVRLM